MSHTSHIREGALVQGDLTDVRFLTVAEVASLMRVSPMTVYRMVQAGELPAIRFGRSYRIPEAAVVELVQSAASGAIGNVG